MELKTIAIAGASGFIGRKASSFFEEKGHVVRKIQRNDFESGVDAIANKLKGVDVILNFAGSPVIQRWSRKGKRSIIESRVSTTRLLGEAIIQSGGKPRLFMNASAIGIYDHLNVHDEDSREFDQGFLGQVVKAWEETALRYGKHVDRLVLIRIGIVLGKNGGAFKRLKGVFRIGIGGYLGNGKQAMSFIHIYDLCRAIEFIINNESIERIVNLVAPAGTDNRTFSKHLAGIYGWKHVFPIPGLALRVLFGQAADTLLLGQKVLPKKLLNAGFNYQYPEVSSAVKALR
jgi:uncharacterized protein